MLQPGQTLCHYQLIEQIGEGGMGVVWKARDTKLSRAVAVKMLPPEFAGDTQRLERFKREAKLLATLNHPCIAAIYGLQEAAGVHFLVLELIEGQTLAQKTKMGPAPVEESLDVCRQIAEGLEAAHEAGVIHRDLKPSNVLVTEDGRVKVVDFGLAKGVQGVAGSGSDSDLSKSPTITVGGTEAGVVLGTAPYMSPEQARGKRLDSRTDIWSFGCVLYECLTGQIAFHGETVTDTLSAVLQNTPDWSRLPESTPRRIRDLLERCLEKNPRNRLHHIADARIEIERALAGNEWRNAGLGGEAVPARPSRRAIALGATGLLAVGVILGAAIHALTVPSAGGQDPPPVTRTSVVIPPDLMVPRVRQSGAFDVTPDGAAVLFQGFERAKKGADRVLRAYARRLDGFEAVPIRGSENAPWAWASPDGRWMAMVLPVSPGSAGFELAKVPLDGSAPPIRLALLDETPSWVTWLPGGTIVLTVPGTEGRQLFRYPAEGGEPEPPIDLQDDRWGVQGPVMLAQPLPDGRHVLAWADTEVGERWQMELFLLDTESGVMRLLVEDAIGFWLRSGHLVFNRRDALFAAPFDLDRFELTGDAVAIMDGLPPCWLDRYACWSLEAGGTLAYDPGELISPERRIVYVTRSGDVEPWPAEPGRYGRVSVSPGGDRLAVTVYKPSRRWNEIWVSEVRRPMLRPLVLGPSFCGNHVWSPDGERIAYQCPQQAGPGGLYIRRWDGSDEPELLMENSEEGVSVPRSFSPDGTTLLVTRRTSFPRSSEILLVPVEHAEDGSRTPRLLLPKASWGRFSSDGRWIAYASDETGRWQVHVRTLSPEGELGPLVPVSTDGGVEPILVPGPPGDSQELIYEDEGVLVSSRISSEPSLAASPPEPILDLAEVGRYTHDILPDGRILMVQRSPEGADEDELRELRVILNFQEEVRRRLAEAGGSNAASTDR